MIATQLLDVSIRVQAVRSFAVAEMTTLLATFPVSSTQTGTMFEVLYAAAWIVGEFSRYSQSIDKSSMVFLRNTVFFSELIDPERSLVVLLKSRSLPGHIQGVYVHNIIKLFTRIITDCLEKKDIQGIIRVNQHSKQIYTI